eukprot:scaffold43917_cov39-Phaeocystis_antarctica.AAC.1
MRVRVRVRVRIKVRVRVTFCVRSSALSPAYHAARPAGCLPFGAASSSGRAACPLARLAARGGLLALWRG